MQQLEDYQKERWELNKKLAIMEKQLIEEKSSFAQVNLQRFLMHNVFHMSIIFYGLIFLKNQAFLNKKDLSCKCIE